MRGEQGLVTSVGWGRLKLDEEVGPCVETGKRRVGLGAREGLKLDEEIEIGWARCLGEELG